MCVYIYRYIYMMWRLDFTINFWKTRDHKLQLFVSEYFDKVGRDELMKALEEVLELVFYSLGHFGET